MNYWPITSGRPLIIIIHSFAKIKLHLSKRQFISQFILMISHSFRFVMIVPGTHATDY